MAELLKGGPVAKAMTEALKQRADSLREEGTIPKLAILRVGERPDDLSYERSAVKRCEKIGIETEKIVLPADADKAAVLAAVQRINDDENIHGCLMFRPLSDKDAEKAAAALLKPEKDVDCMTALSAASLLTGDNAGYPPCTAEACIAVLDHYGIGISGKRVTIVGRSMVIGKPAALLLLNRHATITVCHTRTKDLPAECRSAEILVAAAGKAGLVGADCIAPGQVVIDVGINVSEDGSLCGDVSFSEAEPLAAAITPVPGGVGAVTTAVLAKHVIEAAERSRQKRG